MDESFENEAQELPDGSNQGQSPRSAGSSTSQAAKRGFRTGNACDQCKRRKTKCSGRAPCEACQKAAYTCHFDDGRISKSQLKVKTSADDNQVQHLLNGVLNSIKYNETSVFDGLLHALRSGGNPAEVANHLEHNLDALQKRGIIPNEDIDQTYLLSLANKVTSDHLSSRDAERSTESRQYSFVFEDPHTVVQGSNEAGLHGGENSRNQFPSPRPRDGLSHHASPENDSFVQHSNQNSHSGSRHPRLRASRSGIGANEPMNNVHVDGGQYYSVTPYQTGDPATSTYSPNAYMQNQPAMAVEQHNALQDPNLDYYPINMEGQSHSLGNMQTTPYTFSYGPGNAYASLPAQQDPTLTSLPWLQAAPVPPKQGGTDVSPDVPFYSMQAPISPPQQSKAQTQAAVQAMPPQYYHHHLQQPQRRNPDESTTPRRPP
ncbi:hypothetical protein PMZ80_000445 [Knufia obscura]|uniref:Zn(2)-C6 fungal-type domain-containing protein n=1 Tax=Knufia obscura TaxID=1635080 RepID=A0ABR0S0C5_9EURO|nr:hypothetical protein PMZ80_000445 [Knufia obscura]